jgi:hypothetical protein
MPDEARRTEPQAEALNPYLFLSGPLALCGPALASNAQWNAKLHESFAALAEEWQEFLAWRFNADVGLLRQLGGAKSPREAWAAWLAFWQKAAADYAGEFARSVGAVSVAETQAGRDGRRAQRGNATDRVETAAGLGRAA